MAGADDEFSRTAADIDHQHLALLGRKRVRHAAVDQACLFPTGDHLDGKAERSLGALQEITRILGDPQGVGSNRPHLIGGKGTQTLAKSLKRAQGALLGFCVEALFPGQPRGQAHRLLQAVERVDLSSPGRFLYPANQKPETVGTEVDGGQKPG